MLKKMASGIMLTLFLITITEFGFFSFMEGEPTEISVINPETYDNNFAFFNSTTPVGFRLNATIWLYNVADLYSYQVCLCINDTLLNITNAWLPAWDTRWVFYGKSSVMPTPAFHDIDGDNYIECAKIADTLIGVDSFEGSGLLAIVEFEIIYTPTTGSVSCNLDINNDDTYLLNYDMEEMPTAKASGLYEYVSLPPGTSAIIIIVNATSVVVGETVSITGSVTPRKIDVTVTIQCKLNVSGEVWQNLTKTQTDSNSEYNYTWPTTEAGTFELKSLWEGDANVTGAESKAKLLEVKYTSTISISIPSTSKNVTVGSTVVISGEITPAPLEPANVTIEYRCLNKTFPAWKHLNATTAVNGLYSYDWTARKTWATNKHNETIELKAKWLGDNTTFGSESQTEKVVVWKVIVKVTINVSAQEVVTGSNVTISGTVEPAIANLTIAIGKSRDPDVSFYEIISFTDVPTDFDGSYSYVWDIPPSMPPGETGEWYLKAYVRSDLDPNANQTTDLSKIEHAFINILSGKINSSITINVHPSTPYIGSEVIINGTITPTRANKVVTIHYRVSGEPSWITLAIASTDSNSNYCHIWETTEASIFELYASWKGDEVTEGATSAVITVTVEEDNTPPEIVKVDQEPSEESVYPDDVVKVYANVTDGMSGVKKVILNYTTNNGTWFSIEMTNLQGNLFNATIPPHPYGTTITYVIIAQDYANNTITSDELGYEYEYQVIQEFPTFIILPLFMIATMLAVILLKKKKNHAAQKQRC